MCTVLKVGEGAGAESVNTLCSNVNIELLITKSRFRIEDDAWQVSSCLFRICDPKPVLFGSPDELPLYLPPPPQRQLAQLPSARHARPATVAVSWRLFGGRYRCRPGSFVLPCPCPCRLLPLCRPLCASAACCCRCRPPTRQARRASCLVAYAHSVFATS